MSIVENEMMTKSVTNRLFVVSHAETINKYIFMIIQCTF